MRMREIRSYINKEKKKTGLERPPVEIIFKNGNVAAGHFWYYEKDWIGISDVKFSRVNMVKIKNIKALRKPTVDSLIEILWQQYRVVQDLIRVGNNGKEIFPF